MPSVCYVQCVETRKYRTGNDELISAGKRSCSLFMGAGDDGELANLIAQHQLSKLCKRK